MHFPSKLIDIVKSIKSNPGLSETDIDVHSFRIGLRKLFQVWSGLLTRQAKTLKMKMHRQDLNPGKITNFSAFYLIHEIKHKITFFPAVIFEFKGRRHGFHGNQ